MGPHRWLTRRGTSISAFVVTSASIINPDDTCTGDAVSVDTVRLMIRLTSQGYEENAVMADAAREIARRIVDIFRTPTAVYEDGILSGPCYALERDIAAALDRARAEALEEAAKVAESESAGRLENAATSDSEEWALIERLRAATADTIADFIRALRPAPKESTD